MKRSISVDFEIGFADSYIQSYIVENDTLTLVLKCWNADLLEIKFLNLASIFAMNYIEVADLLEVFESPFLDRALIELYEEIPKVHDFRIFKFITSDDMTALEIVCEDIQIHKK